MEKVKKVYRTAASQNVQLPTTTCASNERRRQKTFCYLFLALQTQ